MKHKKVIVSELLLAVDKYNILGKGNDATKDDARHGNEKRSSMVKKNETEEVDEQYSWSFGCHVDFGKSTSRSRSRIPLNFIFKCKLCFAIFNKKRKF